MIINEPTIVVHENMPEAGATPRIKGMCTSDSHLSHIDVYLKVE